jgi:hypothetical protein
MAQFHSYFLAETPGAVGNAPNCGHNRAPGRAESGHLGRCEFSGCPRDAAPEGAWQRGQDPLSAPTSWHGRTDPRLPCDRGRTVPVREHRRSGRAWRPITADGIYKLVRLCSAQLSFEIAAHSLRRRPLPRRSTTKPILLRSKNGVGA